MKDNLVGWRLEFDGKQNNTLVFININQYEYQSKIVDDTIMNCSTDTDGKLMMKSIYANSLSVLVKSHSTIDDLDVVSKNINNDLFVIPQWSVNIISCVN